MVLVCSTFARRIEIEICLRRGEIDGYVVEEVGENGGAGIAVCLFALSRATTTTTSKRILPPGIMMR